MKYIILQHWTGELRELEELSRDTFQEYADWCGADYELVLGNQVSDQLAPQSQKIIALDERYDDYDVVVMVCLLYTSPSPRDRQKSRMPSSA